jgi:hypothetical protein
VIALACERPQEKGLPLSRYSASDIARLMVALGLVLAISVSTVRRILRQAAIKPWLVRSWIFPRDPEFGEKASRVLDLYERLWDGEPLGPKDYVICADEKTCIQALGRRHEVVPPSTNHAVLVDSEYKRAGTVAYLAALDVKSGRVFGQVVDKTGITPFDDFVALVMQQEPYRSAKRVFWVVDNGASHQPKTFPERLTARFPNAFAVHLPIHASWLNQAEVYFSIVQRKALTPNDLETTDAVTTRLLDFQERYNQTAKAFKWRFTKAKLLQRLAEVS